MEGSKNFLKIDVVIYGRPSNLLGQEKVED